MGKNRAFATAVTTAKRSSGSGETKRPFPTPSRNKSTKQGPNSKTKTALFHYIRSPPLAKLLTFASARRRRRHGGGLWPDGAHRLLLLLLLLLLDHLVDCDHPAGNRSASFAGELASGAQRAPRMAGAGAGPSHTAARACACPLRHGRDRGGRRGGGGSEHKKAGKCQHRPTRRPKTCLSRLGALEREGGREGGRGYACVGCCADGWVVVLLSPLLPLRCCVSLCGPRAS